MTRGMNDTVECPSESARRRHAAHAEPCPTCSAAGSPVVAVDPTVRFGRPHVAGISAAVVADAVWAGESPKVVADLYSLTRAEVLVACWYQTVHARTQRHWGDWARGAFDAMRHGRWDDVEDPPSEEEVDGRSGLASDATSTTGGEEVTRRG